MQVNSGPLIDLSVSEKRLTDNFRLIQAKIRQYDGRLDAVEGLVDQVHRGLKQEKLQSNERFEGLELNLLKSIEHKITNSIHFYVSSQIRDYLKVNQPGSLSPSQLQGKLQWKVDQMKAAVKSELTRQNQDLIKAQVRQIKKRDRKKEKEDKERKLLYGSISEGVDPQLGNKLDDVFTTVDEVNAVMKEQFNKMNKMEQSSYHSISQLNSQVSDLADELRECKRFVTDNNESLKMQLVKLKTQVMIPLERSKPISEQAIIVGFAQLRENMANCLTKTQFQSLYNKSLWNNLNLMKEELDCLKKQVKSHDEQRKYLGHITEGIEKYEQFISSSFEKASAKQQSIRQAFAERYEELNSRCETIKKNLNEAVGELTGLRDHCLTSLKSLEERWTSLEYQQSITKQEIELTNSNLEKSKQGIDSSNYSMKHMASEFDKKVNQTVSQLKQTMNKVKQEFDALYSAQAKKSEMTELWKAVNILQSKLDMFKNQADQVYHLNKRSWMLAESEIVRGKGSLDKHPHTVFTHRSQKTTLKMSELAIKTTRYKPKEELADE